VAFIDSPFDFDSEAVADIERFCWLVGYRGCSSEN
jgi:hypothetical protein